MIINRFEVKELMASLQERASPFPAIFCGCASECLFTLLTLVGKKEKKTMVRKEESDSTGRLAVDFTV